MSPVRFTNTSNSGRARFLNVASAGKVSFYVSTSTTTTTTTQLYLISVYGRLTSNTGADTWQAQYQLNGGSWTAVGGNINSTTCTYIGDIGVPNSGTDDVVIRVVGPDLSTPYQFSMDLNSFTCPTAVDISPFGISCNRLIANVSANRNVAFIASTSADCITTTTTMA